MDFEEKVEKQALITALDDTYHQIEAQISYIREEAAAQGLDTPLQMRHSDGKWALPELLSAKAVALDALSWMKYGDDEDNERIDSMLKDPAEGLGRKPTFYGASAAIVAGNNGLLKSGDMKLSNDGSLSVWDGDKDLWLELQLVNEVGDLDVKVIFDRLQDDATAVYARTKELLDTFRGGNREG